MPFVSKRRIILLSYGFSREIIDDLCIWSNGHDAYNLELERKRLSEAKVPFVSDHPMDFIALVLGKFIEFRDWDKLLPDADNSPVSRIELRIDSRFANRLTEATGQAFKGALDGAAIVGSRGVGQ